MLNFLLLMAIPTFIALVVLLIFKRKVTIGEFCLQIGIIAVFLAIALGIAYEGRTSDTEVWNGQIVEKKKNRVSCEHSYRCHCHTECTGTGSNRSCEEVCDTCYEHSFDVDWDVYASTGESVTIERIDRQGLEMPARWGSAFIGEPFSSEHHFTNYIKANPDSVLLGTKGDAEKFKFLIPPYPDGIYDYYRHNPVVNMGVPNIDMTVWNWLVNEANKNLGPQKQVNIIVILVPTEDRAYMLALKDAWFGGKKNDVDVVIGSKDGHAIAFADVMSWSTNKEMAVHLKNRIQDVGWLDKRDDIRAAIQQTVNAEFVRMHMRDMRWLMRSFQPSGTVMVWLFIVAVIVECALAYWCITNEIQEEA